MSTVSPLARKLQLKPGHRLLLLDAPAGLVDALAPLPEGATITTSARGRAAAVLLFVRTAGDLERRAAAAIAAVGDEGLLWIAYPKKSSGVATDLTRDVGWAAIERAGWGGVAQVAIDATWSALRFRPEAAVQRKAGSAAAPGARMAARPAAARPGVVAPAELVAALAGAPAARATWDGLAPSHRREYVGWIEEAKRPETRARRVAQAVEMLSAGVRDRHAKYR
jgi:hypothetical protein